MTAKRNKSSTSVLEEPILPPQEEHRFLERPHRRSSPRISDSQITFFPKAIIFIIGNELCERFTYYGLTSILVLFLKDQLDFSESAAATVYHIFVMFCYFFPLLGGILADSWLGKFRTILYLAIVYASGDGILSISAIPGVPGMPFAVTALILIAAGAGSVKPCMAAFGGDQFVLPQQETQLKKFFSMFYFTINLGSFIGSTVTPVLRQTDCLGQRSCYSLGFAVPAAIMTLSIGIFVAGTKVYKKIKPSENISLKFCKCIGRALRKREKTGGHWLDKASDKYDPAFIEDVKAVLRVLVLYIPLPFFWALFDQQGSRWTFQASRMNGDLGVLRISPDQMQVINAILILVFIPVFEAFLYPSFAKYNFLKKPLQRLTVGGLLAALSFVVSALVEYKLEETYAILPKPDEAQIRIFNALPENITLTFASPHYEPVFIRSLDFWNKYDIPAQEEATVKIQYTVGGTPKTESLVVYENSLTSYIITANRSIQIRNDDPEKSEGGLPKVRIVYLIPTKSKTVSVDACKESNEYVLTKEKPYTDYKQYRECERYQVTVDRKPVISGEMKAGGVYVVLILEDEHGTLKANALTVIPPNSIHMLWLVPQYVIITAAEVMFSITGLEFSYTQAPLSMKALLQAAWLLTIAVGNLIVAAVAQAKIFERMLFEFLLFAGLMTVDMFIFALMAKRYKYVLTPSNQNEAVTRKT